MEYKVLEANKKAHQYRKQLQKEKNRTIKVNQDLDEMLKTVHSPYKSEQITSNDNQDLQEMNAKNLELENQVRL